MKGKLILENGMIFEGEAFGCLNNSIGEVVFNTSMAGYQEVLTDPVNYGQIVVMTYPLIGGYGINIEDTESNNIQVSGLVVREKCDYPNNFRCEFSLDDYLKQNGVIGLEGVDTRALTKIITENGTMKGIISLENSDELELNNKIEEFSNIDAVENVATKEKYIIDGKGKNVVILDFGVKKSSINEFASNGCKVTVLPYTTRQEDILKIDADLIFLSEGPGNPQDIGTEVIDNIKGLIGKKPIVGVGLGHEIIALALGGTISKLSFGHRGSNYPVRDLKKDKIYMTSQNHGYYVKEIPEDVEIVFENVNEKSCAGIKHKSLPIFSVQFDMKIASTKEESNYIFNEFMSYAL